MEKMFYLKNNKIIGRLPTRNKDGGGLRKRHYKMTNYSMVAGE